MSKAKAPELTFSSNRTPTNSNKSSKDSCELFYFCGGQSLLCRGGRPSCWAGCPSKEVLSRIAELELDSFDEGGYWTAPQLREVLTEGASTVSVVLVDKRIVGFAMFRSVPPEGELIRLAVDSRYKRKGYGHLLLHDGLEMLIEKGIEEVFLEVAENNNPAISLYSSFGFVEAGRRKNYYPHLSKDGLVMKKDLSEWPISKHRKEADSGARDV